MPIINISNTSQFYNLINSQGKVLCLYYWNSCPYCIEFAPVWRRVTQFYKDKITIVNIEAVVVNNLDNNMKIMSFPTVLVFNNGKKLASFNQKRTDENLDKFIRKHFAAPVKPRIKSSNNKKNR